MWVVLILEQRVKSPQTESPLSATEQAMRLQLNESWMCLF